MWKNIAGNEIDEITKAANAKTIIISGDIGGALEKSSIFTL